TRMQNGWSGSGVADAGSAPAVRPNSIFPSLNFAIACPPRSQRSMRVLELSEANNDAYKRAPNCLQESRWAALSGARRHYRSVSGFALFTRYSTEMKRPGSLPRSQGEGEHPGALFLAFPSARPVTAASSRSAVGNAA